MLLERLQIFTSPQLRLPRPDRVNLLPPFFEVFEGIPQEHEDHPITPSSGFFLP